MLFHHTLCFHHVAMVFTAYDWNRCFLCNRLIRICLLFFFLGGGVYFANYHYLNVSVMSYWRVKKVIAKIKEHPLPGVAYTCWNSHSIARAQQGKLLVHPPQKVIRKLNPLFSRFEC